MAIVLYGVAIHKAAASGDLAKMKAVRRQAEAFLAKGKNVKEVKEVKEAMNVLDRAIAKLEKR